MRQSLKNFARAELDKTPARFPYYEQGDCTDPEKINAIYPEYEWLADGPGRDLTVRGDWQHIYAVDSTCGDYVEVFFERLSGGVAVAWARLRVNGRRLTLREACYKDHSDVSSNVYSAGGIRLECTGPLRYWRVAMNAFFLEEPSSVNNSQDNVKPREVHVKMGSRLSMMSHPFEIPKQCPPSMLVRRYETVYANDTQKIKDSITNCCGGVEALAQGVALYAEVSLDGERKELLLQGCRLKFLGKSDLLTNVRQLTGYADNGTVFHLMETSPGRIKGYCFHPSFFDKRISKGRVNRVNTSGQNGEESVGLALTFNTATKVATFSHKLSLSFGNEASVSTLNASPYDAWSIREIEGSLTRDKSKGKHKVYGVLFKLSSNYNLPPEKLRMYSLVEPSAKTTLNAQVVSTLEDACRAPALTGGKGSSLAVLTAISKYLDETTNQEDGSVSFTVPPAVVLTVEAYKAFADLPAVKSAIKQLLSSTESAGSGKELSTLKAASERCIAELRQVTLPNSLEQLLVTKLAEVFGAQWESRRFAVRSSAVGEDSEEMSAAGQMTTYLGVVGKQHILEAVVKCWSSQFALTAIEYKHQYGQILDGPMAVVIQEMARAQCAGVMFTCDPVTSRPGRVVLTANFGLGESVVSATADPDTYTLQTAENYEAGASGCVPTVTLLNTVCGAKDRMIVEAQFGVGTEEKIVAMDEAQKLCLSNEQAIRIATIGLKVTEFTDTPRDIEWALDDGQVVLLQSRPVTSVFRESDFEIQNDLNSALYTHREILSRANLDEVMPGVFSVMSLSLVQQLLFESFSKTSMEGIFPNVVDHSQYTYTQAFTIGKKAFMNFSSSIFGSKQFIEGSEVTMFGCDISEHEALKNGVFHEKKRTRRDNMQTLVFLWRAVRSLEATVKNAREQADNTHIDLSQEKNSLSMLLSLLRQMHKFKDSLLALMSATFPSSLFNILTLNILKRSHGQKKATPEMMVTLSKLLRSDHEVESARIPEDLTNLATSIRNDPKGGEFAEMAPEDALKWLESDEGEAAKEFRRLRTKHAHRCYKEFDIHAKTWDLDPTPLVRTLQANVRAGEVKKKEEERMTIADLERQPSLVQKKLLSYIIPRAQYSVYAREATKSCLVKSIHQIRLAVRRLGQQLHEEGRLPDPELVFFLTADELYRLIKTRNPSLLPRAIRRSKMHTRLDKQKFAMLLNGWPKPIESEAVSIPEGARSISGTPVSQGVVVGVARVIHDFLSEAHLIQKGDILVTRATDTGWTPYFSLLGGVVTELGGLLSHGAVVAREYGLPAVVGVLGATEFFKSGEIITLDGNKGVVAKPDESTANSGTIPDAPNRVSSIPNSNGSTAGTKEKIDDNHNNENGLNGSILDKASLASPDAPKPVQVY